MFENGNYRRRRRMKRPYRTGSHHFNKMFGDGYSNFARGVFPQPTYQTYPPRYDTGLVLCLKFINIFKLKLNF